MPTKAVWQHIDVPLPSLKYENVTASGQGKGTTEWAAHSHTPIGVELWGDFDELVTAEGQNPRNLRTLDFDLRQEFFNAMKYVFPVSKEEDVTIRLETVLSVFSNADQNISGGFNFRQHNQQIIGNPDLVAQKTDWEGLGVGDISDYKSPLRGERAGVRRDNTKLIVSLYRMPFETKPLWKFAFLKSAQDILDHWEIPEDFDPAKMQAQAPLPEDWPKDKQKIFHLVRQIYGQMVADKRRYGVITLYERWFFCKTSDGILKISRSFEREAVSPSVLQAIKTMVGFVDYELEDVAFHPQSASKAPPKKKNKKGGDSTSKPQPPLPPSYGGGKPGSRGRGEGGAVHSGTNLAASLQPWECNVYDVTGLVLLLTTARDPTVIVKLQKDPRKKHVADEMAQEAAMYAALEGNEAVQEVIPRFRGHSTHLGVAMTCIEREMDDLEDIGLENVSEALKQSAVHAIQVLSEAGVLHNDIELRNIVRSKRDPSRAKIIDFGRASFSGDSKLLAKQVERIKILLNTENSTYTS
jgi:predicted Ser/Thr protein kinase